MIGKKIVFMGTGPLACEVLQNLYYSHHDIVAILTKAPKAQGRGMKIVKNPVQLLAEKFSLQLYMPEKLHNIKEILLELEADLTVVASYGLIIPQDLLWLYKYGTINIHPSALPRWRGAAPIERSMIASDKITQLCIMQMDADLDTGPVLMRYSFLLDIRCTGEQLMIDYAKLGYYFLEETIKQLDKLNAQPQTEIGVTYASKILASDEKIDWNANGAAIVGKIMALSPKAYCVYNDDRLRLVKATLTNIQSDQLPGKIVNNNLGVVSGDGYIIEINQIQKPGGKIMDTKIFLLGNKISIGATFI